MNKDMKYFGNEYIDYYNNLKGGNGNTSQALRNYIGEVSNSVNSVINELSGWRSVAGESYGQVADLLVERFNDIKDNIDSSLTPACEAMDKLKEDVETFKKEQEKLDKLVEEKEALDKEMASLQASEPVSSGEDDDGYEAAHAAWQEQVNELQGRINSKQEEITAQDKKVQEIKTLCDESIEKIKKLEDNVREFSDMAGFTNEFSTGKFSEMPNLENMKYEDRIDYLNNLVGNYKAIYDGLNDIFKEKYGEGIKFTGEDFKKIDDFFDTFELYWMSKVDRGQLVKEETDIEVRFDIEKLGQLMSYCDTKDVFTKIGNYVKGQSWQKSGLEELYGGFLDTNSANFFNFNALNEERLKQKLMEKYGVTGDIRAYLKETYGDIINSVTKLKDTYKEFSTLYSTMAVVQTKIDNINNALKLLPYEVHMDKEEFQQYLGKNYENYSYLSRDKLENLNQQEVALYDYLRTNVSEQKANEYLNALQNTINERVGKARAEAYVNSLKENGFDVWDLVSGGWEGTKDGVRNFFDGIADVFRVANTGKNEYSILDYELRYKSELIQELMQNDAYINQDLDHKSLGLININNWYNTGSSVGNMLVPSIVGFVPVVGQGLSTALMTASITGNTAVEAKQQGYSTGQAYLYGALSGASETFTEVMFGGIPGISNLEGKGFLGGIISEGLEEFVQEYMDLGLRHFVLGEDVDLSVVGMHEQFSKAAQAGIQGSLTSGIMQIGNASISVPANLVTKALSPMEITSTGTLEKKYTSFGEFKNSLEAAYNIPRAKNVIDETLSKVENGETLNLYEKIELNKGINKVSAEELSTITNNLTEEQTTSLKEAAKGIPFISKNLTTKIDTAEVIAEIKNADVKVLPTDKLTKENLQEAATRDGRSLAEYIADTKAQALDNRTMSKLELISSEARNDIVQRVKDNTKAYNERIKKLIIHKLADTQTSEKIAKEQSSNTSEIDQSRTQEISKSVQEDTYSKVNREERKSTLSKIQTEANTTQEQVSQETDEAVLGAVKPIWQYEIDNGLATLNINMDLIDTSVSPKENLRTSEINWKKAGSPQSGQLFEAYQNAYQYAHQNGGVNTKTISKTTTFEPVSNITTTTKTETQNTDTNVSHNNNQKNQTRFESPSFNNRGKKLVSGNSVNIRVEQLNKYKSYANPNNSELFPKRTIELSGIKTELTITTLGEHIDIRTGKISKIYSLQCDSFMGKSNDIVSTSINIFDYITSDMNMFELRDYLNSPTSGIQIIKSTIVNRPEGRLLVLNNGTKNIAGVKLNQYLMIDEVTGKDYIVYTETNLFEIYNGNNQIAQWLTNETLNTKTANNNGYIGDLKITGDIVENNNIISRIKNQNFSKAVERSDFENAINDKTLPNTDYIGYEEIVDAKVEKVRGKEIDSSFVQKINEYVKETNSKIVLEISSIEDIDLTQIQKLDENVIIHYDEFFGDSFYENIDINDLSINQLLSSYYDINTFIERYKNMLYIKENISHFNEFKEVFKSDTTSNEIIKYATTFFFNQIENGNYDALQIMDSLTKIKKDDPLFKIVLDNEYGGYYSSEENVMHLSKNEIENNNSMLFFHEIGHCLFDKMLQGKSPSNIKKLFDEAQKSYTKNKEISKSIRQKLETFKFFLKTDAKANVEERIIESGYKSVEDYKNKIRENLKENEEMVQNINDKMLAMFPSLNTEDIIEKKAKNKDFLKKLLEANQDESLDVDDESFDINDESYDIDDESFDTDDESFDIDDESFDTNDESFDIDDESLDIDEILNPIMKKYSVDEIVELLYNEEIMREADKLFIEDGYFALITGMIDHLFFGNSTDLNGIELPTAYGHGYAYFHDDGNILTYTNNLTYNGNYSLAFHEMVADYVSMKMTNNQKAISMLESILGPKLIAELDNTYKKFINQEKAISETIRDIQDNKQNKILRQSTLLKASEISHDSTQTHTIAEQSNAQAKNSLEQRTHKETIKKFGEEPEIDRIFRTKEKYKDFSISKASNKNDVFPTRKFKLNDGHKITIKEIGTYIDPKTSETKTLYSIEQTTTQWIKFRKHTISESAIYTSSKNINDQINLKMNYETFKKYLNSDGIQKINSQILHLKDNNNIIIIEDGTRNLAGFKLNQYIIINQNTGIKYSVCTETDIIYGINSYNDKILWLNTEVLEDRVKNNEGYIGYLDLTGKIKKNEYIEKSINNNQTKRNYRFDLLLEMANKTMPNVNGKSSNETLTGNILLDERNAEEINQNYVRVANEWTIEKNQKIQIHLKSLKGLNLDILKQLNEKVIICYEGLYGNGFYSNIDLNQVSINQKLNSYFDVKTFVSKYENLVFANEHIDDFNKFIEIFGESDISENNAKYITTFIYNQIVNGKKEALNIMNMLTQIKTIDPTFKIEINSESKAYYEEKENKIHFSPDEIEGNQYTTFFHEVGHCLFHKIIHNSIPSNIVEMFDKAQKRFSDSHSPIKESIYKRFEEIDDKHVNEAIVQTLIELQGLGYPSTTEYIKQLESKLKEDWVMMVRVEEKFKILFGESRLTAKEIATKLVEYKVNQYGENLTYSSNPYLQLHGMIDHLFFGNDKDLNGNPLPKQVGHGYNYFHGNNTIEQYTKNSTYKGDYALAFDEMVADYISFKLSDNSELMEEMIEVLGEELVKELEKIYQVIINYANNPQFATQLGIQGLSPQSQTNINQNKTQTIRLNNSTNHKNKSLELLSLISQYKEKEVNEIYEDIKAKIEMQEYSIEKLKEIAQTLAEDDVSGKEEILGSIIATMLDEYLEDDVKEIKEKMTREEQVKVYSQILEISEEIGDTYFDIEPQNTPTPEAKQLNRILKSINSEIEGKTVKQISEIINDKISENLAEIIEYKQGLNGLIDQKSENTTRLLTAMIEPLIETNNIPYIQEVKSRLNADERDFVINHLNEISPKSSKVFEEIKILDEKLLKLGKSLSSKSYLANISDYMNNKDAQEVFTKYFENSENQESKKNLARALMLLKNINKDSITIDFQNYLNVSDLIELLEESIERNELDISLIKKISNNQKLYKELLETKMSNQLLSKLLEQASIKVNNTIEEGKEQNKYTIELDGLSKEAMKRIGELLIHTDKDATYEFKTNNGLITKEQLDREIKTARKYKKYSNYDEYKVIYEEKAKEWFSKLSQETKDLFKIYVSQSYFKVGCYGVLNGILRENIISKDGQTISFRTTKGYLNTYTNTEWKKHTGMSIEEFRIKSIEAAQIMNEAMKDFKLIEDTEIIRGINFDALSKYGITEEDSADQIFKKLTKQGQIYIDPGFMSSSPTPGAITKEKNIQLVLNCEKGTSFVDLSLTGLNSNPGENEVLLPVRTKFHIDNVIKKGEKTYIYMSTIGETNTSQNAKITTFGDNIPTPVIESLNNSPNSKVKDAIIDYLSKTKKEIPTKVAEDIKIICESNTKLEQLIFEKTGLSITEYSKKCRKSNINQAAKDKLTIPTTKLIKKAKDIEPSLTRLLTSLENNEIKLVGLDFKFKTEESIIRKMFDNYKEDATNTYYESVINDTLRYTLVINPETYELNIIKILQQLNENGFTFEYINNAWGKKVYQGINVKLKAPNDLTFEIQFHTEDSYSAKEEMTHEYYEIARSKSVPEIICELANNISADIQRTFNGNIPHNASLVTCKYIKEKIQKQIKH